MFYSITIQIKDYMNTEISHWILGNWKFPSLKRGKLNVVSNSRGMKVKVVVSYLLHNISALLKKTSWGSSKSHLGWTRMFKQAFAVINHSQTVWYSVKYQAKCKQTNGLLHGQSHTRQLYLQSQMYSSVTRGNTDGSIAAWCHGSFRLHACCWPVFNCCLDNGLKDLSSGEEKIGCWMKPGMKEERKKERERKKKKERKKLTMFGLLGWQKMEFLSWCCGKDRKE